MRGFKYTENFILFKALIKNPDYYNVRYDKLSGGMSAIQKGHIFSKTKSSRYGFNCGKFEKYAIAALRRHGHSIVLISEKAAEGIKTPDGFIDGVLMDIKAVEGIGKWAIKSKLHEATIQRVSCVVLYFHEESLFSLERINDGWLRFQRDDSSQRLPQTIEQIICIVKNKVIEYSIPQ